MMYAADNGSRVNSAHNEAADSERNGDEPLNEPENAIFDSHKQRTDKGKCKQTRNKQADQRRYKQINDFGNDFMELFLHCREYQRRHNYRNDMPLISHHVNVV